MVPMNFQTDFPPPIRWGGDQGWTVLFVARRMFGHGFSLRGRRPAHFHRGIAFQRGIL